MSKVIIQFEANEYTPEEHIETYEVPYAIARAIITLLDRGETKIEGED